MASLMSLSLLCTWHITLQKISSLWVSNHRTTSSSLNGGGAGTLAYLSNIEGRLNLSCPSTYDKSSSELSNILSTKSSLERTTGAGAKPRCSCASRRAEPVATCEIGMVPGGTGCCRGPAGGDANNTC